MLIKTGIDAFNNIKKIDPFGYHLNKYNTVIMLKQILKHTTEYLEDNIKDDDVKEWIF